MRRFPAILAMTAVAIASLTACGGGGSSTPATSPTAAPVQTVSVQRSLTSQALTSISSTQQFYQFGGTSPATASAVKRRISAAVARTTAGWHAGIGPQSHRARAADGVVYSACSNSIEDALVTVSPTESQEYIRLFYDSACTQLWQDIFIDVISTSSSTATATGTTASYTTGGTQYDYETLVMTIVVGSGDSGEFSLLDTDAATSSSPQRAALGIACILGTTLLNCGSGAVEHLASVPGDDGALLNEQFSVTSSGGIITIPYSATASGYASGLNTLTLAAGSTFPTWAITGSAPFDTSTISGQLSFYASNGALAGGTLTVTDAADDGTVTAIISGSPATISGTVKQTSTGRTVATFVVDANGNGTVTYSNGSTAQVSNWVLLG